MEILEHRRIKEKVSTLVEDIEDAQITKPSSSGEVAAEVCPPCFLMINDLSDPDFLWGKLIKPCIDPDRIKSWAQKHANH